MDVVLGLSNLLNGPELMLQTLLFLKQLFNFRLHLLDFFIDAINLLSEGLSGHKLGFECLSKHHLVAFKTAEMLFQKKDLVLEILLCSLLCMLLFLFLFNGSANASLGFFICQHVLFEISNLFESFVHVCAILEVLDVRQHQTGLSSATA